MKLSLFDFALYYDLSFAVCMFLNLNRFPSSCSACLQVQNWKFKHCFGQSGVDENVIRQRNVM